MMDAYNPLLDTMSVCLPITHCVTSSTCSLKLVSSSVSRLSSARCASNSSCKLWQKCVQGALLQSSANFTTCSHVCVLCCVCVCYVCPPLHLQGYSAEEVTVSVPHLGQQFTSLHTVHTHLCVCECVCVCVCVCVCACMCVCVCVYRNTGGGRHGGHQLSKSQTASDQCSCLADAPTAACRHHATHCTQDTYTTSCDSPVG